MPALRISVGGVGRLEEGIKRSTIRFGRPKNAGEAEVDLFKVAVGEGVDCLLNPAWNWWGDLDEILLQDAERSGDDDAVKVEGGVFGG